MSDFNNFNLKNYIICFRYESDSEPSSLVLVDREDSRSYIFDPYRGDLEETVHYIGQGSHGDLIPDELSIIYEEEGVVMNSLPTADTKPVKETKDALDATDAIETMTNDEHIPVTHKHEEFQTKKIHEAFSESPIEAELSGVCHQPDVTEVVDRVIMWRGAATNVMVTGEFSNWSPLSLASVGTDLWLLNLKLQKKDYLMKYIVDGMHLVNDDLERTEGPNNEIFNVLRFENEELDQVEILRSLKGSPLDSMKDSGYDQSFEERKQSSSSIGSTSEEENNSQILESSSSDSSLSHDVNEVSTASDNSIPLIRKEKDQLTVFLGEGPKQLIAPTKQQNLIPLVGREEEQLNFFMGNLKRNVEKHNVVTEHFGNVVKQVSNSIPLSRNENHQLSVFCGSKESEISTLDRLTKSVIKESLQEEQHKIESITEEPLAKAYRFEKERIKEELEDMNNSNVDSIVENLDFVVEDRITKEVLKNRSYEKDEKPFKAITEPIDHYYALENIRISEELTKSSPNRNSSKLIDHDIDIKTEESVFKETKLFTHKQKCLVEPDHQNLINIEIAGTYEKKRIKEEFFVLSPELENEIESNITRNFSKFLNENKFDYEEKIDDQLNVGAEIQKDELEILEKRRMGEDKRQAEPERLEDEKRQAQLEKLENEKIEEKFKQADLERLEKEKIEEEKRQAELERLEKERIEEELKQAELERLEKERIEEELKQAELERIEEKRKAELQRLEKERIEEDLKQAKLERLEKERIEEELKQAELERLEKERIEEELKHAELERLEKEKIEEGKRQAELERMEKERIEEELKQAELERLEKEKIEEKKRQDELERLEKERIEEELKQTEFERLEKERIEEEMKLAELERLEEERIEEGKRQAELESLEKEKIEEGKRQAELERLEKERIEEELKQVELERLQKEKIEEEKRQDDDERVKLENIDKERKKATIFAMEEGLAEFERLELKKNTDIQSDKLSISEGSENLGFIDEAKDKPQVVTDEPRPAQVVIDIKDDKEIDDDVIINGINTVETNITKLQEAANVQERNIEDVESGPSSLISNQKTPVLKKIYGLCSCNIL